MPISMMTMSGRSARAFSSACRPLSASPTTCRSVSSFSSARMPSRRMAWSSASRMRIGLFMRHARAFERDRDAHARALTGALIPRVPRPPSAAARSRIPNRPMCCRLSGGTGRVESNPIPSSSISSSRSRPRERRTRTCPASACVEHVADRFLRDPEHGRLDLGRQSRQIWRSLDRHVNAFRLQAIGRIPPDRRRQAQVVQDQWPQVGHQRPQVIDRPRGQRTRRRATAPSGAAGRPG